MSRLLFFFSLGFLLACFHQQAQAQLVLIPDTNLREALRGLGYIKNDSLDAELTNGRLQLNLENKQIESIEGLQYFRQLKRLNLATNTIHSISEFPPKLTIINLSFNPIDSKFKLPEGLKGFSCSSCQLNKINVLPQSLSSLNVSKNNLTTLPILPKSLHYLNYSDNPIEKDSLPIAFKYVDCSHPFQNCLPFPLRNVSVFQDSIPFYESIESFQIEISGFYQNRQKVTSIVEFQKKGKHYVSKGIKTSTEDTIETPDFKRQVVKFEVAKLDSLLHAIRDKRDYFKIPLNGDLVSIDLRDKIDIRPLNPRSSHPAYIDVAYSFHTPSDSFSISVVMLAQVQGHIMPYFSIGAKSIDLHKLIRRMYLYQLTNLTIPNTKLTDKYFTEENLQEIYDWSILTETKN